MCVIRGDEAPFVFADVIHFAAHVVVAAYDIYLVLIEEALVRHAQLVHCVQTLPAPRVGADEGWARIPTAWLGRDQPEKGERREHRDVRERRSRRDSRTTKKFFLLILMLSKSEEFNQIIFGFKFFE